MKKSNKAATAAKADRFSYVFLPTSRVRMTVTPAFRQTLASVLRRAISSKEISPEHPDFPELLLLEIDCTAPDPIAALGDAAREHRPDGSLALHLIDGSTVLIPAGFASSVNA